jgi:hypothetical protein
MKLPIFIGTLLLLLVACQISTPIHPPAEEAPIPLAETTDPHVQKAKSWLTALQLENGLLESSENSNFVSLYDNALAAMVFLILEETEKAEKIFDYFNSKLESELKSGVGGFSQFRDRYGNANNHRWMGDNAWLLIALNNYQQKTGSNTYKSLAQSIENWLRSLQDVDGGVWGGYDVNNALIHKISEGNIDAFNAVPGYDSYHQGILQFLKTNRWDSATNSLVAWPGNPQYLFAMDLHPWAYSLFEDYPEATLTEAERYLTTVIATATNEPITGYCFDDDKDVVWLEGTGEMVVAFNVAGNTLEAERYLTELEKLFIPSVNLSDAAGLPYASNLATGYGNGDLWQGVDTQAAISSTAWYLFGKLKFNPFEAGRTKNTPISDRFWQDSL